MKIWLDDIRTPPDDTWTWVKNAYFCMGVFIGGWNVEEISFDHDLGYYEGELDYNNTGYAVAKLIERLAHDGLIDRINWSIHSANPIGRENIEMAMKSAEKFWEKS